MSVLVCMDADLHELERSFKVLDGVHLHPEELHAHDESDDALHHVRTLFLQPQFLQLSDELLAHRLEPAHTTHKTHQDPSFTLLTLQQHTYFSDS